MTDVAVTAQQQQNITFKRQKRSRFPSPEPLKVPIPKSQVKHFRELCQIWEDTP